MKKNKYTVVIFLGILIALLLFILFFLVKEGVENNCKYLNLNPPSLNDKDLANLKIDTDFKTKFIAKFNESNKGLYNKTMGEKQYNTWTQDCNVQEMNIYRKLGRFPLNEYIINQLNTNKEIKLPSPYTKQNINITYSNRQIFRHLIMPTNDVSITQEVTDIFEGNKPECPEESTTSSTTTSTTVSTLP